MFYILRRKGNLFSKETFEYIMGEGSLAKALENKQVERTPSGYYKGINNNEYRQWRRIPDLYDRSGARKYINEFNLGPISLNKAKELGINVPMALASGFVIQRPNGLMYDTGKFRPVYKLSTKKDYSDKVIARVGNKYPKEVIEHLNVDKRLFNYNNGFYEGTIKDSLNCILTFENDTLVGLPYIMLDQLYSGKVSSFDITKENLPYIIELIYSGHIFVYEYKIYLDNQDIKRHKFYNWVGKAIYCGKRG